MSRGDRTAFQARAQHVVSSADLLRGFGATQQQPIDIDSYMVTENLNFDAIDLASPPVTSEAQAQPGITITETRFPPDRAPHVQSPQSFAHGLALLEAADPSRKRTISTATARAIDTDRAPKTQKTSPSRRESLSQPGGRSLSTNNTSVTSLTSTPSQTPEWSEFIRDPGSMDSDRAHTTENVVFTNAPFSPTHNARSTTQPYTPSPLARNGMRPSRSSSYSSHHPSLSSYGLEYPIKAESSQSSAVPSRPISPETTFFTESEAEIDWEHDTLDRSLSRRSSRGVLTDSSPSRPTRSTSMTFNPDLPSVSNLVPANLKGEMNRIFDVYLQSICSNRTCSVLHSRSWALVEYTRMQWTQRIQKENLYIRPSWRKHIFIQYKGWMIDCCSSL